jgi:hypothetical protein
LSMATPRQVLRDLGDHPLRSAAERVPFPGKTSLQGKNSTRVTEQRRAALQFWMCAS